MKVKKHVTVECNEDRDEARYISFSESDDRITFAALRTGYALFSGEEVLTALRQFGLLRDEG